MAQLDTLQVYENLIEGGFSHEQAHAQVKSFDNSFNRILKDFASNRLITIFGFIIVSIGSFTLYKVWDLSIDVTEVKIKMSSLEARVDKLDNDFHNFIKR
jgi:hypothetical protein